MACVYNGCMDAASVPSGFITTREYSASQGVALNSASRALKRMAEAGAAVKVGAANWILADEQDNLSKLLELDDETRLRGIYGNADRRISHRQALVYAGVPLLSGLTVSSPCRISPAYARKYYVRHRRENGRTLKIAANQIGEQSWVSDPARAFVEYSQHVLDIDSDEIIQRVLAYPPENLTADEIAAVGEEMGWRSSLRRIASVATSAAENGSPLSVLASELADMEFPANRGDRWIDLNPKAAKLEQGNTSWADMRHKVKWHITPAELHEHLLY